MPPKVAGTQSKSSTKDNIYKTRKIAPKGTPRSKAKPAPKPGAIPKSGPVQSDLPDITRLYNCKKCLTRHAPPTGARSQQT